MSRQNPIADRPTRAALDDLGRGLRRAAEDDVEINDVRRLFMAAPNGLRYRLQVTIDPSVTITGPDGSVVSMLPVVDNSAYYGEGAVRVVTPPSGMAAISVGDMAFVSMATLSSGTTAHPDYASISIDFPGWTGGCFMGSLSASNRLLLGVYGFIPAYEFTATPYVGVNAMFHAGNLATIQSKTAGYTEASTSGVHVRLCDLAAGFTVVLPTAVGNKAIFTFKKLQAAGSIVIDGNASETIDGALTKTLTAQYEKVTIISDGANWWIV